MCSHTFYQHGIYLFVNLVTVSKESVLIEARQGESHSKQFIAGTEAITGVAQEDCVTL